jgi:hypothetical protein
MEAGEGIEMAAQASPGGAERREEERYAVDWDADIFIPERTTMFRGRVVNLSVSGCYVRTVAWVRVPPTTVVELVIKLDGRLIRVEAEARYAQSRTGVGLRFLVLEKEVRQRLDWVIEELRETAAVVVDEIDEVESEPADEVEDVTKEAEDRGMA